MVTPSATLWPCGVELFTVARDAKLYTGLVDPRHWNNSGNLI
jgi:hypothetical protein